MACCHVPGDCFPPESCNAKGCCVIHEPSAVIPWNSKSSRVFAPLSTERMLTRPTLFPNASDRSAHRFCSLHGSIRPMDVPRRSISCATTRDTTSEVSGDRGPSVSVSCGFTEKKCGGTLVTHHRLFKKILLTFLGHLLTDPISTLKCRLLMVSLRRRLILLHASFPLPPLWQLFRSSK